MNFNEKVRQELRKRFTVTLGGAEIIELLGVGTDLCVPSDAEVFVLVSGQRCEIDIGSPIRITWEEKHEP